MLKFIINEFSCFLLIILAFLSSAVLFNISVVAFNFLDAKKIFCKRQASWGFNFFFLGFGFILQNSIRFSLFVIFWFEYLLSKYFVLFGETTLFLNGISFCLSKNILYCQAIGFFIIGLFLLAICILQIKIRAEEVVLFNLLLIFVYALFCSNDFLGFMLALEGLSFILYIFASTINVMEEKIGVKQAGAKYLILGLFSSSLLLFGLSILYAATGLVNFTDYLVYFKYVDINSEPFKGLFLISFLFLVFGFLFKLSVAPFHLWLVDIYRGIEDHITFFFAIFTKPMVVLVFLFKFSFLFFVSFVPSVLFFVGCCSIIFGTFGAIVQYNIKGLIAYSSISNIGYVIVTISLANLQSFNIGVFYVLIYSLLIFVLFFILYHFRSLSGIGFAQNLYDYKNYFLVSSSLVFNFSILLFSLIGLPPLIGFFIKFYVILNLISQNFVFFALFFVVLSVIGSFYYVRIIKDLFFYGNFIEVEIMAYPITTRINILLCFFFNGVLVFMVFFSDMLLSNYWLF
jgi:NADH-quinone oxidoreductase subunit N